MTRIVLSVAYPFATVDADPVGGAEQVLSALDRALVAAGWRSIVIAREGSTPAGELVAVPKLSGEIDAAGRAHVHAAVRQAIAQTLASERVDLIHLHGIDFADYLPPHDVARGGPPTLATLHLPIAWYAEAALRPSRPNTWLLPVSASQAASAPPELAMLAPIENGVSLDGWPRPKRRCGYALCLGRICPEKGFHLALDAAKAADIPLLIAGEVFAYPEHQAYFDEEIAPRLDARRRWLGPVTGSRKRRLIAAARCVVIPSLAAETSSLVAREAAAAGTPVVAHRIGALAETVEDGRTGFLVEGVEAMAAAILRAGEIGADVCRAVARERFDRDRMTGEYLALYERLILPSPSRGKGVHLAPDFAAVEALAPEWLTLFRATDSTPFRSPGCLLSWGRHHAPDRLAAVVVREGGRLVGLVPAFDWRGALMIAGTGPTDYNHGLFETGRVDVATAALAALADLADARDCAVIDLRQMRPDRLLLAAETPHGWSSEITPGDVCPIAPVLGEDGLGAMPEKWRKKLSYTRRKMDRAGGCTIEAATPGTVGSLTDALFALHAKRWAALGEPGVLGEPLMRAFIADALPAWLDEGLLRLWALRIEGEIAAVVCNLQTPPSDGGGAAHMYLTGFDPAHVALGPGTLLIAHTIEQAAKEGAREIRFLRGEEPYKANWGAVAQPTFRRTLTRR